MRFVRQIWLEVLFCFFSLSLLLALSLWTQKTSHEINARQRKHLARWNYGEASGRWNFCFISFHCFPLSPIRALVGRRNIKGTALANTTNKLLPHSLDWIERRLPVVRSLWVTQDSLPNFHNERCHRFQTLKWRRNPKARAQEILGVSPPAAGDSESLNQSNHQTWRSKSAAELPAPLYTHLPSEFDSLFNCIVSICAMCVSSALLVGIGDERETLAPVNQNANIPSPHWGISGSWRVNLEALNWKMMNVWLLFFTPLPTPLTLATCSGSEIKKSWK